MTAKKEHAIAKENQISSKFWSDQNKKFILELLIVWSVNVLSSFKIDLFSLLVHYHCD